VLEWITILAALAGSWVVLCTALALWGSRGAKPDELHTIQTEDGWQLSLYRFVPAEGIARREVPLVFAHGLNMNRTSWALSPRGNLLRAMAERGHDVFAVEYRGTAQSRPLSGSRWRYGIDDIVDQDLPALLSGICKISGSEQVHWVGHSMGGMLLYLYCARHGSDKIRRVATLGSPVRFKLPFTTVTAPILRTRARFGSHFRMRVFGFLTLPFSSLLGWIFTRSFLNPRHLGARERVTLCSTALEDVSWGIHRFFIHLSASAQHLCPGIEEEAEGVEIGGLARLQAPLLVISGSLDRIAPPTAVEPAFDRAGSPEAAYICLGAAAGGPDNPRFGHCDLASSAAAIRCVVPLLANWFENTRPHAPSAQRSRALSTSSDAAS